MNPTPDPSRFTLNRRSVLRGIGASITLPFLESLAPRPARAAAAGATPPTRMAFLFMPNGIHPKRWTPEGEGMDWKPSPLLEPLAAHRQDLSILTNLQNALADGGDGHYAKSASWLTGYRVRKTTGRDVDVGGPSIDQAYAATCGHHTRLTSLELGTEPVRKGVDLQVNFTQLYGGHIAWRDRHVPLPAEINPRTAFDRLFRERGENDRQTAEDTRSVLDLTLEQARTLRGKVSQEDQRRLDEYLETIRALETRIAADIARVASGENLDPSLKPELDKLRDRISAFGCAMITPSTPASCWTSSPWPSGATTPVPPPSCSGSMSAARTSASSKASMKVTTKAPTTPTRRKSWSNMPASTSGTWNSMPICSTV
mgnify:CR=1 FL=1